MGVGVRMLTSHCIDIPIYLCAFAVVTERLLYCKRRVDIVAILVCVLSSLIMIEAVIDLLYALQSTLPRMTHRIRSPPCGFWAIALKALLVHPLLNIVCLIGVSASVYNVANYYSSKRPLCPLFVFEMVGFGCLCVLALLSRPFCITFEYWESIYESGEIWSRFRRALDLGR